MQTGGYALLHLLALAGWQVAIVSEGEGVRVTVTNDRTRKTIEHAGASVADVAVVVFVDATKAQRAQTVPMPATLGDQLDEVRVAALAEYLCARLELGMGRTELRLRFRDGRYDRMRAFRA
jgi:hypothetical protein